YQYCGGDPVGKLDPSGEWAVTFYKTFTWRIWRTYRAFESAADWIVGAAVSVAIGRLFPVRTVMVELARVMGWACTRVAASLSWIRRELGIHGVSNLGRWSTGDARYRFTVSGGASSGREMFSYTAKVTFLANPNVLTGFRRGMCSTVFFRVNVPGSGVRRPGRLT
ncbi:MAG: hypothetical protein QMC79_10525, partial [Anaerosomatales bacterium]|nr:hypothetical protein [Anaerosomatales bacterium]